MTPYYADDTVTLHHGDCLDVLRSLPDASVDAVVTDPPYGLADHHPRIVVTALSAWLSGDREHVPDGRGFMGRDWDRFVPPPAVWDECLRVLKPGGHLLAFAGSRTEDLMAMSIRLAGFEIRDGIDWLYASGFPKSLDVSKAIDKRPGVGRHAEFAAHLTERREAAGLTGSEVAERVVGSRTGACWNWEHHQFPEAKWWPALRDLLGLDEAWGLVVAEADRKRVGSKRAGLHHTSGDSVSFTRSINRDADGALPVTAPATDDARRWSGWGTALKPAREPIVVARKPLAGTVAANVLAHGVGALNIDACRVAHDDDLSRYERSSTSGFKPGGIYGGGDPALTPASPAGRWPSNVVLSHVPDCTEQCVPGCPVAELDRQSGVLTSGTGAVKRASARGGERSASIGAESRAEGTPMLCYGDSGGASRFFPVFRYEAKAPTAERPRTADGTAHPTVKPLHLMRWLVRLVTPPGGVVLEPFAGSGTTAEACILEGFRCIAIEREAAYLPLIVARLTKPLQPSLDLFGGVA